MIAKTKTCAAEGLGGRIVEVEVDLAPPVDKPVFNVVGLPEKAIQEARERVRAAITNSGMVFPEKRITISLVPAGIRKSGTYYDLPMAVGILVSSGQLRPLPEDALLLGELSLDGSLRPTRGILPMVNVGRQNRFRTVFVPHTNQREAALISGVEVVAVKSLIELVEHLKGSVPLPVAPPLNVVDLAADRHQFSVDMADIKGQEHVKSALLIAAAGGHNVLMQGPPGTGKTLLARAMNGILPPMTEREIIDTTSIYSVAGLLDDGENLKLHRPFRAPHYTASEVAIVGGGTPPKPGEITLSNHGVLFLDELPEFSRRALEALRQPLEDKHVVISRATATIKLPAKFMLVAAMNPCPCGYHHDGGGRSAEKPCICTDTDIARYKQRISGPLLDRMDIFLDVPRQDYDSLAGDHKGESSEMMQAKVAEARQIQLARFRGTGLLANSDMGPREIERFCILDSGSEAGKLLKQAVDRYRLSARAMHRTLKLARTIADLERAEQIAEKHVLNALGYRGSVDAAAQTHALF